MALAFREFSTWYLRLCSMVLYFFTPFCTKLLFSEFIVISSLFLKLRGDSDWLMAWVWAWLIKLYINIIKINIFHLWNLIMGHQLVPLSTEYNDKLLLFQFVKIVTVSICPYLRLWKIIVDYECKEHQISKAYHVNSNIFYVLLFIFLKVNRICYK